MADNIALLECPLCSFSVLPSDDYVLRLHFEQMHTEDSPFRIEHDPEPLPPPLPPRPSSQQPSSADDAPSDSDDEKSVLCPEPDCGEVVLLSEFNDHLDLHTAATLSIDETTGQYHSQQPVNMQALNANHEFADTSKGPSFLEQNFDTALPDALRRHADGARKLKKKTQRTRGDSAGSEKSTLSRTILAFNPFTKFGKTVKPSPNSTRLGRAELGPHAWEDRMPKWLHDQLANGPKITVVNRIGRDGRLIKHEQVQNETPGIIPILAQLSALDRSVKQAYYCHPSTLHIGKTPREGGFCGYRNIQMLVSYIQGAHAQGSEEFPGRTPGILKLQDLIERAWDKGINEIGRQQTGGIRDTRKYIGTPEAQALFLSTEIDCAVELLTDSPDGQIEAHEQLLYAIESYFSQAAIKDDGSNIYKTLLPPIYLQQPGHSITIVGFERRKDGACNLVTFDPMYHTSPAMLSLIGRKNIRTPRPEVMHSYRRLAKHLRRHAAFEILMLTAHPPLFPAWDILRQFPDCRYLYAFFRSKTLGYDVYPEDHFLRNFPWQQYGGLWIVDDARFARAEKLSPLSVQALRRITGEGASPPASTPTNNSGSFSSSGPFTHTMGQFSTAIQGMRSGASSRVASCMSNFDGSQAAASISPDSDPMDPLLDRIGTYTVQSQLGPKSRQPTLTLQVPQLPGKRYPGYPSPTSPTPFAKQLFPSPDSEGGTRVPTPRPVTPVRSVTPMSIDGSEMCGPSRNCDSHCYDRYINKTAYCDDTTVTAIDNQSPTSKPLNSSANCYQPIEYVTSAKIGGIPLTSSPRSLSPSAISPTSPPRPMSPRTAMLKNIFGKQALQIMNNSPLLFPTNSNASNATLPEMTSYACTYLHSVPGLPSSSGYPTTTTTFTSTSNSNSHSHSHPSQPQPQPPSPSVQIANGTETSTASPISPAGTMLQYTSHRPVDNGLLALKPLSEAQVAEYRFWRPCGRWTCAFGCGGGNEGEVAAAKRLFRVEEEVREFGAGDGEEELAEGGLDGGSGDVRGIRRFVNGLR